LRGCGTRLRVHDQHRLCHALRDVEPIVRAEPDAVGEEGELDQQLDAAVERRACDTTDAEILQVLPVVRVRVVEQAVGTEAQVVGRLGGRTGEGGGDVASLPGHGDALDAARNLVWRLPLPFVPEREAAVVGDVERAVRSQRGAVRTAAGLRQDGHARAVPDRHALAANLYEGDSLRSEPDRSFREAEPRRQHALLHGRLLAPRARRIQWAATRNASWCRYVQRRAERALDVRRLTRAGPEPHPRR